MNNFYIHKEIRAIHIEFTSRCNLRCPQCARTQDGKITENLPLLHMPLSTIEKVFGEMGQQVTYAHICGNYGDLVAYPYFIEAVDIIHNSGVEFIKAYTNASAKDKNYWQQLAERFNGDNGHIIFSIDGLEDTNHLYRVGSNWDKIMTNAKTFIDAGGVAVWEWLPFEHNDHQVEEAKELAKSMGFKSFIAKRNPRFASYDNGENSTIKHSKKLFHTIHEKHQNNNDGLKATRYPVGCKYKRRNMVFIDFEGYVIPCCWLGNRYKGKWGNGYNEFHDIMEKYGMEIFDITKYTLKEILNNDWYAKDMQYTIKTMPTCRKHCELFAKMSNKDNRDLYLFDDLYDPEPWEGDDIDVLENVVNV